jgi:ADP-heptose:LPS heptosyltransferase
MRPLLEGHPLIEEFIALPPPAGTISDAVAVLTDAFRSQHAADLVHLHPDKTCQLAGWLAVVPRRLGYRHSLFIDWTLTRSMRDRRREGLQHEAQYNFDLLAEFGIRSPAPATLRPSVHLAERWKESLRSKLASAGGVTAGRYIVLNPTAYSVTHRWPAENFAWLARELRTHCERVVLIGEPADDPSVQALRTLLADFPDGLADLAGCLNLGELGWLLKDASLLVSRNTGTTHLAAAVGCPTVELFGRLEPIYGAVRWRSLGERVRGVNAPAAIRGPGESKQAFWRRSFAGIRREDVLAAALDLLAPVVS